MNNYNELRKKVRDAFVDDEKSGMFPTVDWVMNYLIAQGRIVPDGYVAVPSEPTEEMLYASKHAMENLLKNMGDEERKQRYGEPKKGIGYVVKWKEKHAIRYKAMIAAVGVEKCQKR